MVAKADNDPKPTDQERPTMDNKKSVLSCGQNALDEFPSARLSLARLCPHRALFSSFVFVTACRQKFYESTQKTTKIVKMQGNAGKINLAGVATPALFPGLSSIPLIRSPHHLSIGVAWMKRRFPPFNSFPHHGKLLTGSAPKRRRHGCQWRVQLDEGKICCRRLQTLLRINGAALDSHFLFPRLA